MAGVTGLRPLINDPVGPHNPKHGSTDKHINQNLQVNRSKTGKTMSTYVRDSMCKLNVGSDEHSDDETVKTANSSTINTESTIDTDILYDNDDDDKNRVPDNSE